MSEAWRFSVPDGWQIIKARGDGYCLREINGGLRVIVDCSYKDDGRAWVHVSYSRAKWTPSHEDTCKVKAAFLGDRYAYAVFPPQEKYVNIHQHCLHLWALAEGDSRVLPEFSGEIEGVGLSI